MKNGKNQDIEIMDSVEAIDFFADDDRTPVMIANPDHADFENWRELV